MERTLKDGRVDDKDMEGRLTKDWKDEIFVRIEGR